MPVYHTVTTLKAQTCGGSGVASVSASDRPSLRHELVVHGVVQQPLTPPALPAQRGADLALTASCRAPNDAPRCETARSGGSPKG